MEIFTDITYEVTLNLAVLRKYPDISGKLQYLATDKDIKVFKKGSEFQIRAPRKSFKPFQELLYKPATISQHIIVRSLENESEVESIIKGRYLGKAEGSDIVSIDPKVSLATFCVFMAQNFHFITEKLKAHQCSLNIVEIDAKNVYFNLSGPSGILQHLDKLLRDRYFTISETIDEIPLKLPLVENRSQAMDKIAENLKPIIAIAIGNVLKLVFPHGEVEDSSHIEEQVSVLLEEFTTDTTPLEQILEEIWRAKLSEDDTGSNEAAAFDQVKRRNSWPMSSEDFEDFDANFEPLKTKDNPSIEGAIAREDVFDDYDKFSPESDPSRKVTFSPDVPEVEKDTRRTHGRRPKAPVEVEIKSTYIHSAFGMKVHCCIADITNVEVDCIVNAGGADLRHLGGVALAIARAAGSALDRECDDSIRRDGFLKVTEVRATTGGRLPCKKVLHTFGPKWDDYRADECVEQLQQTIDNCLNMAEELKITSIAIPAISSGMYGIPMFHVARATCHAICTFCLLHSDTPDCHLREVYLVDPGSDAITAYEMAFKTFVNDGAFEKVKPKSG